MGYQNTVDLSSSQLGTFLYSAIQSFQDSLHNRYDRFCKTLSIDLTLKTHPDSKVIGQWRAGSDSPKSVS